LPLNLTLTTEQYNYSVMKPHANIVHDTVELGQLMRSERKSYGITLQQTSDKSNIGIRFLSELERGKATAEIGKVISALNTVGLDLAVVQKPIQYQTDDNQDSISDASVSSYTAKPSPPLSEQLNLEFPYEWSNADIDNDTFIRLVLAKTRFNDILCIAHHFGIEQVTTQIKHFDDTPQFDIINKLLSRIQTGIDNAETKNAEINN